MPAQQGVMSAYQLMAHTHQGAAQGGQLDHGLALTGLGDSDHPAHFDIDATKPLTGGILRTVATRIITGGTIGGETSWRRIDTEGGAASDDVDTILAGGAGEIIYISALDPTHTVVMKHGTGNIDNGSFGDITLDNDLTMIVYFYSIHISKWLCLGVSNILTKARIDALNINADQVDGEQAADIVTQARVDAVLTKAAIDALAINADQVDGVEGAEIVQRDGSIPLTAEWQANQPIRVTYVYSTAGGVIVLGEVAGQTRLVRDANEVAKILGVSNAIGGIKVNKVIIGANELNALVANNKIGDSSNWDGKTFGDLNGKIRFNVPTELTINAGVITVTKSYHKLLGQGGAADDLDTINGGVDGMMLVLKGNGGHNITVKDGTGNIELDGSVDFLMDVANKKLLLIYDATTTDWCEISRGINSI